MRVHCAENLCVTDRCYTKYVMLLCYVWQVFASSQTDGNDCSVDNLTVTVPTVADSSDEVSIFDDNSDVENDAALMNNAAVER